ncbi:MAG TPA: RHS repeat-associated core domain-containing protein, partial [Flavisolibacter sp.]|nr:RHS repeat-associated core domain-containing protein [Flavisolibacter sp.]
YQLIANGGKGVTGLGITVKVMSGDRIDIFGKSYSQSTNAGGTNYSIPVLDLLKGLFNAPLSVAGSKGTADAVNSIPSINNDISNFLSNPNRPIGTNPRAAINWILLDEQFNYVDGNFSSVNPAGGYKDHTDLMNIPVNKNGYLYVYCSNESPMAVYFDNLQVVHTRGQILEETHYYPFGLTMQGISSSAVAFGNPGNKFKYNGKEEQRKEFSDGSGLEWLDYGARMYDNQLGRWMTMDPLSEKYFSMTPFNYVLNNPIGFIDYDGMDVYIIFQDGRTVLARKEDKPDILYVNDNDNKTVDQNKDGKIDEKDGLEVKTKGMLEQLTKVRSIAELNDGTKTPLHSIVSINSPQEESDLRNLFLFISNNTLVEFNLTYFKYKGKDYISLATVGQYHEAPSAKNLGLKETDIYKRYHDHPNVLPSENERSTMGEDIYGRPYTGDYQRVVDDKIKHPEYVYFKHSTNLYNITQRGIQFVQKINNDIKKLKK